MDFYKLDKIDKIVISIVFILGALSSIFGNFVFASDLESVSLTRVSGVGFSLSSDTSFRATGGATGYVVLEPGYIYYVHNSSSYNHNLCFSNDIPAVGVPFYDSQLLMPDIDISFYSSTVSYLYVDVYDDSGITVTREKSPGYNEAIFSLSDNVSGQLIWNSIESAMPFILVCTLFGLGTVFIHRLIKSGSKGKAKLF